MVPTPANHRYRRDADAFRALVGQGHSVAFRYCPVCGSTVYWEAERFANWIAVAVGAFADPTFPAPTYSVFERRRHGWLEMISHVPIEHSN